MSTRRSQVGCGLAFAVEEPARILLQVAPSATAGTAVDERLDVLLAGRPVADLREYQAEHGRRNHVFTAEPGDLSVDFVTNLDVPSAHADGAREERVDDGPESVEAQAIVALRQSRYCESDRLAGFAQREFIDVAESGDAHAKAVHIAGWVFERLTYVAGASASLDSAVDTLLGGEGVCRDFAHLTIALCRALDIPARLASVYAPGLSPMDFHAVTEVLVDDTWFVLDSTRLAPRSELIRIATGRDAADTAFATVLEGRAELLDATVFASSDGDLAEDDHTRPVSLR